jgi:hypothetical protein
MLESLPEDGMVESLPEGFGSGFVGVLGPLQPMAKSPPISNVASSFLTIGPSFLVSSETGPGRPAQSEQLIC